MNDKGILVTGGTGSFGRHFIKFCLNKYKNIKRLVVFSRDELKQWEMMSDFPPDKYPNIRFFLGDIRDKDRIKRALQKIDIVVHAAALKQVPAAEFNPMEFIKTNVIGSENVLEACLDSNVKKVVALSTDKAASPINLYGATKLCADKLFVAGNNIKGRKELSFSVVRYGNVIGSRGSIVPLMIKKAKEGYLPITDKRMTRFSITLDEGVRMVDWAINNTLGGEIIVPKIPSYKITDLAEAIGPNCEIRILGIRAGEKLHEEMITSSDSHSTIELQDKYIILPSNENTKNPYFEFYSKNFTRVEQSFRYVSNQNNHFLNVEELRNVIKNVVDPSFKPV